MYRSWLPESNKETLLLVAISRFIEFQALSTASGSFDASFQVLSRLDDEYGTKKVYEWLVKSGVSTHVYGIRDRPAVVDDLDLEAVALVAEETGPNVWGGLWIYDPERINRVQQYVRNRF